MAIRYGKWNNGNEACEMKEMKEVENMKVDDMEINPYMDPRLNESDNLSDASYS